MKTISRIKAKLNLATRWEVKVEGKKRSIQLFDANGKKLDGSEAGWKGDFDCSGNQLTTLEGAPKEVGGDFYCSGNQLTTLEGAPKEVGGGFYCYSNQLTTLEVPTIKFSATVKARISLRIFASLLKRKIVFADGIMSKLISKKEIGASVVFKVRIIGKHEASFVVKVGDKFAHGKTIKDARESVKHKISDRDTSKFKGWKLSDIKPASDLIEAYRAITGACEFGTRNFVEGRKVPKKMTVQEAIKITSGQYGSDEFAKFFAA